LLKISRILLFRFDKLIFKELSNFLKNCSVYFPNYLLISIILENNYLKNYIFGKNLTFKYYFNNVKLKNEIDTDVHNSIITIQNSINYVMNNRR
jgi:hypothetical protein